MDLLITPIEFSQLRDISKKIDTEKVNEAISLAQQSDLIDILGEFYFDVLKNSEVAVSAYVLRAIAIVPHKCCRRFELSFVIASPGVFFTISVSKPPP